jgi:hypothetical protein
MYYQ